MEYQKIINWIDNIIADAVRSKTLAASAKSCDGRIMKFLEHSQQNNSETLINENGEKIPKERYLQRKDKRLLIILVLIW